MENRLDLQLDYWNQIGPLKPFAHPVNITRLSQWTSRESRILDYGCGYGRALGILHDNGYRNLTGVDPAPAMIAAARQAVETGQPVIRPVFWAAPDDPETWPIKDAYLMGDNYLVAPVVTQGATTRDVYLPAGHWRDYWSGAVLEAGWHRNYPAPLDTLPLFVRLD